MSKYEYKVFEVSDRAFNTFKFEKPYRRGLLADGISGLNGELLFVVGYKIKEGENEQDES